ncbi:hypothetical protein SAMN05421821_101397 [Mucilaginibacter lappiensis]|nr:hypothetical protein SAMN05421821_101397 [Mucilaginibacter lappiensis]
MLFSEEFLKPHLTGFRLSSFADIEYKRALLKTWFSSMTTGKIDLFKEEEIKSRFVLEIFGDILGFNYKNPTKWLFREELKSKIDSTKPDAALGVFQITDHGIEGDVNVVVEIKDIKTDLDKRQNRAGMKLTPVDQAFLYASKMGGHCNWVVVSNFKEIRFYNYRTQVFYQSFTLQDLQDENNLMAFLFLFHKDRLTNSYKSSTDKLYELRPPEKTRFIKETHIVDQIYLSIKKFQGLGFIDPDFICNIKPFNILDDHVWHYKNGRMISLNQEIASFLNDVKIVDGEFIFSHQLIGQLKIANVTEVEYKLKYILDQLKNCGVTELGAIKDLLTIRRKNASQMGFSMRHLTHVKDEELVLIDTEIIHNTNCDCVNCNYRSLDFKAFLQKLKRAETEPILEPLELAYAHYMMATDNFKKSYHLYKKAEEASRGHESKINEYFVSKINQISLHNLVESYDEQHDKTILKDIKSIDLDRSIHNELDIYVDNDVRKYLLEIKENKVYLKIKNKANELIDKLEKGSQNASDLNSLSWQYNLLYSYFHKGYLVFDAFSDFKILVSRIMKTFIKSFAEGQLNKVTAFHITEAIMYMHAKELQDILMNSGDLLMTPEDKADLVNKTEKLLRSYFKDGFLGHYLKEDLLTAHLVNYHFQEKFTNIFSNLFTVLSKVDLNDFQVKVLVHPIIGFVLTEDILAYFDLTELGKFIERHGGAFKAHELLELLKKAINNDSYGTHKYHTLLKSVAVAYHKFHPDSLIQDIGLVKRAVANATDHKGELHPAHLIPLFHIFSEEGRLILLQEFENSLINGFEHFLYIDALGNELFDWEYKDFFSRFVQQVNAHKRGGLTGFENNQPQYNDVYMINLIYQVMTRKIPRSHPVLQQLTGLSEFEIWALDPKNFNYENFDPMWLLTINHDIMLSQFHDLPEMGNKLKLYLANNYQEDLSKIYFKYFI